VPCHELIGLFYFRAKNHEQVMKEEFNFEAVRNLDWYLCEVEPTVRSAMKSWNMSVQYWLAAYVYKRFPVKPMRYALQHITRTV